MKKQATLILGPAELAGLLREYPDKLRSRYCIALTPDAYEHSKSDLRLKDISYPIWVQSIRTFSIDDYQKIKGRLIILENESWQMREQLFPGDSNRVSWNYQSNYFIAAMVMAARSFALQCHVHLLEYDAVDIVSLGHAGEFYFDSCLQPTVLCHELQRLGINAKLMLLDERAKAVTHQPQLYESMPNLFSKVFAQAWKSDKKSVLIATTAIYSKDDQLKLSQVLNSAYPDSRLLVYPLPLWPVFNASDLFSERCTTSQALEQLSAGDSFACVTYSEWLTTHTEKFLIDIIEDPTLSDNPLFRAQINRLHKRHLFQTLSYLAWKLSFSFHKSQMLALTIQDSSIDGPLASAAMSHGVQVIVFPHSHIVNWPTLCDCIVATEWWQPVPNVSLWGNENQCIYFDKQVFTDKPTLLSNQSPNWMILFNGVQENLASSVAWPFIQQVADLTSQVAEEANANLIYRLKPGDQTPLHTFCKLLGLENTAVAETLKAPLADLLMCTDLVISVDEPSSALWEAISMGCAVLLVTDRALTAESMSDGKILRPIDLNAFRNLLFSFVKNPRALEDYRKQQQEYFLLLRSSRVGI